MHEYLARFWERPGSLRITHTDLTYSTSVLGSDRLFKALSTYFQTYFNPLEPVLPKHIATSNGLGAMIEHIAAAISDPGEAWLVSAPYYYGFGPDLDANSQVQIASVHVPREQCNTLAEVELLDAEMERRERDVVKPKITAVLITNPHNPLGFCYSREVLLAYCRLAQRWNLFLVSDEIYANSVYDARESLPDLLYIPSKRSVSILSLSADIPDAPPFTSILSLDVKKDAGCSPARILCLYGMSKDFGANGFRAGAMVCQHNDKLLSAIASKARPMRMGSPSVRRARLVFGDSLLSVRRTRLNKPLLCRFSGYPLVRPLDLGRLAILPRPESARALPRLHLRDFVAPSAPPPLHAGQRWPLCPCRFPRTPRSRYERSRAREGRPRTRSERGK